MEMTQNTSPAEPMDDSIQIKDLLYLCLAKWKWFILSLLVTLSLAFLYLLKTPSVYTRSATLLIKENTKGSRWPPMSNRSGTSDSSRPPQT